MIQIGNGNWAVKEDNLLGFRYDETEGVYFPREMTFGRACDATRVNPDGLIERVPYNLIQQSQTFENWTVGSVTVSANSTTAPDGTLSADTLIEVAATAQHQLISATASFASGVGYSFSIYAKASTSYVLQLTHNNAFSSNLYANFDLQNGVVGTYGAGTVASISDAGNGWYRCTIYGVATATASGSFLAVLVDDNTSASRRPSYAGDGTSSVYIWGAQLVEGTTAKPYFPTTNRQDIARIDYSSGTGALLLEPQRTNLLTYSEQFDNGSWIKSNCNITANTTTSPDGTQNADSFVEDTATSQHYIRQNFSAVNGVVYTQSYYVKPNGRTQVQLEFSFGAKPVFTLTGNGSATLGGVIENVGNGWYKISWTATATVTATLYGYAKLYNGGSSYAGDGTSGVYIWGAQLEAGSYPTSYIPTAGSTVTRLADTCYKTGVADWIGQTEGVLFGEFYVPQIITAGSYVRTIINDGTSLNQIAFFYYPDGRIQAISSVGGSIVVSFNIPLFGLTAGTHKFAFGYKLNDYVLFVDGVNVGSDTSATVPSMSVLNLYDTSGGSMYYKHATIYKTRLSNSELAALTTI